MIFVAIYYLAIVGVLSCSKTLENNHHRHFNIAITVFLVGTFMWCLVWTLSQSVWASIDKDIRRFPSCYAFVMTSIAMTFPFLVFSDIMSVTALMKNTAASFNERNDESRRQTESSNDKFDTNAIQMLPLIQS
jgi:hypothetical protein